jgi:UDPglucose--hexose-1-phosphate uridylyltransferase
MSEIRQDVTTKEWVIISTERLKRPSDFQHNTPPAAEKPPYSADCPFCPGNENLTRPAVLSYTDPASGSWKVRIVSNMYPAVTPTGGTARRIERGFFLSADASGYHEVIIENPVHNKWLALMTDAEITDVLKAFRQRYDEITDDPSIKSIIIFKNHGLEAGTSLEHPHSQLVAATIVPRHMRQQYEVAISYYDDNGRSLYAALTNRELNAGSRIVMDTKRFVAFHPFASHRPFETWIMPTDCHASFGAASMEDFPYLAHVLRITLLKLYQGLNNPDFNMVIDSSPVGEEHAEIYQWHIRIIPRITRQAGFEIGSSIYINTAFPEETAKFMREFRIKE